MCANIEANQVAAADAGQIVGSMQVVEAEEAEARAKKEQQEKEAAEAEQRRIQEQQRIAREEEEKRLAQEEAENAKTGDIGEMLNQLKN